MRCRGGDDERGSIIPLVPVLILAFLLLGGLIIDGSRYLNARGEAQAYAEEAARSGATQIDKSAPDLRLDTNSATAYVAAYCAALMRVNRAVTKCELDPRHPFTSAVTCTGRQADIVVNTDVTMTISPTLLGMVHPDDLTTSARAKARPYEGTNAANAC